MTAAQTQRVAAPAVSAGRPVSSGSPRIEPTDLASELDRRRARHRSALESLIRQHPQAGAYRPWLLNVLDVAAATLGAAAVGLWRRGSDGRPEDCWLRTGQLSYPSRAARHFDVSVRIEEKIVGWLRFEFAVDHRWTADEEDFAEAIAGLLGRVLELRAHDRRSRKNQPAVLTLGIVGAESARPAGHRVRRPALAVAGAYAADQ